MADPRFHTRVGPFTLAELADVAEAEIGASGDPGMLLSDVAPLENAGADQLSFLDNRKYISSFENTKAAACIVAPELANRAPEGIALLLSKQPYKSYALAARAFYPVLPPEPGIARSSIESTASGSPTAALAAIICCRACAGDNELIGGKLAWAMLSSNCRACGSRGMCRFISNMYGSRLLHESPSE